VAVKFKEISVVLAISLLWISSVLIHTHGRLLVGGDWPGYYDSDRIYSSLVTPKEAIYDLALMLAGNDMYFGFYLGLSFLALLVSSSFFYFCRSLFKGLMNEHSLTVFASLSTLFYLFSLPSIRDTFKSVIGAVSIEATGFFLFLAELSNLMRSVRSNEKFDYKNMVLMGVGIGLSGGLPPNTFRILAIESIIFVGASIFRIISLRSLLIVRQILRKSLLPAAISLIVMSYWIIPFASNIERNTEVVGSAYLARSYGQSLRSIPDYATLIQVFRLTGAWQFREEFVPYHEIYSNNFLITFASFMWPILALGLPLLLCKRRCRKLISFITVSMLAVIFWEKAGNPPLGEIYVFLTSNFPQIQGMFPTYFLQLKILAALYPIMVAFSIVEIYMLLHGRVNCASALGSKIVSMLLPMFLTCVLLISVWPIWSGTAIGQYFNSDVRGITVPEEYILTKNLLKGTISYNQTVLFYPAIRTYVRTSWNYQGTNKFYNSFFSPIKIATPDYFGDYAQYNLEVWGKYLALTTPRLLLENETELDLINREKIRVYHAAYELKSNSSQVHLGDFSFDSNTWMDVSLPFTRHTSFSNYTLLTVEIRFKDHCNLKTVIDNKGLWIGVASQGHVGWYILGSSVNSQYEIDDDDATLRATLIVGSPDKPWDSSTYYIDRVDGIFIKVRKSLLSTNSLTFSVPTIHVSHNVILSENYISLLKQHNIKYISYDISILEGALTGYKGYDLIMQALLKSGALILVYDSPFLQLYEIQFTD